MLYYLGLSRMNREESIALTAQLKTLTGLSIVGDSVRKTTARVKNSLMGGLVRLLDRQGRPNYAEQLLKMGRKVSWDTETLTRGIHTETARLSLLSEGQLADELRTELRQLSGQDNTADERSVAIGILERAARSLGIDPSGYVDPAQLELVVFKNAVLRQHEELQKRLRSLSPAEMEKLTAVLEQELNRLSRSEREAIQQFAGTEQLSGKAMLAILRTLSGAALAKMIFAGAGFGAFLFLTTMLKATSMLLGITLSFGAYATAASTLALLASGPVLALVAGLSGGFVLHKTNRQVEDQLAQVVVVSGHWRMSGESRE